MSCKIGCDLFVSFRRDAGRWIKLAHADDREAHFKTKFGLGISFRLGSDGLALGPRGVINRVPVRFDRFGIGLRR
jgi:hypothetical protein